VSSSCSLPPSQSEEIERLRKQLKWAELKIKVLEERLRLQLVTKYGPASEQLNDAQLELLELEPGVSNIEVQAESERKQNQHQGITVQNANTRDDTNCLQICRA
jgi:hypothetical protein